jgi:hypothetical protein
MGKQPLPDEEIPEERRKEIFQALVEAQDIHEFTVAQSRSLIARRFGVTERQLRAIEDEGQERLW